MGSHVSLGPEMWPCLGGLGAVPLVRDQFCRLGTQLAKNCFGFNLTPPTGIFGISLARRNRVRAAQLSCSNDVGWFHPFFFLRNSRLTNFWRGLGDLQKFRGRLAPKTGPKRGFSRCGGPFWAKRPVSKFDHILLICADPVAPVWAPM